MHVIMHRGDLHNLIHMNIYRLKLRARKLLIKTKNILTIRSCSQDSLIARFSSVVYTGPSFSDIIY